MATAPKPKKIVIPKTLGGCADRLFQLKAEIAKLNKQVEELDKERKVIGEHVINTLPKSEATGVSGKLASVKVVTAEIPQVKDWDKFYEFVRKSKRTDLLQKRVAEAAITEIWENGKNVPGVEPFKVVKISLNKVA